MNYGRTGKIFLLAIALRQALVTKESRSVKGGLAASVTLVVDTAAKSESYPFLVPLSSSPPSQACDSGADRPCMDAHQIDAGQFGNGQYRGAFPLNRRASKHMYFPTQPKYVRERSNDLQRT
jgi:hypothetical protein